MRGMFAEDTYEHSLAIILRDEVLKGLVGEGCSNVEDGMGVAFASALYMMI